MNRFQIQPSPQARNARKPLVNLTTHFHNISQQMRPSFQKPKNMVPRSDSTQSIKARVSLGENHKINQIRHRKNSLMANKPNIVSNVRDTRQKCRNHAMRYVSYQIVDKPGEMYCFQCALVLSRQNIKVCHIKENKQFEQNQEHKQHKQYKQYKQMNTSLNNLKNSQIQNRQNQLSKYLAKCFQITLRLSQWQVSQNKIAQQIFEQFSQKIQTELELLEIQLKKTKQAYMSHIKALQKQREARIQKIKKDFPEMHKIVYGLNNSKLDIQGSIQGIKNTLSEVQFEDVMTKYWKIIDKAQVFIKKQVENQYKTEEFCIDKEMQDQNMVDTCEGYNPDDRNSDRKMRKSKQSGKDFTFSKNKGLETPEIYKTLKGIKFADSQGQSDPRLSSMRSSVVDSKFTFE